MKKNKKILIPAISVLIFSLLVAVFSFVSFADDEDYSRPGTVSKVTLDSAQILKELGVEIKDAEAEYLSLYGEYSISYGSHIPTSGVKLTYDEESAHLRVFAEEYIYKAENGTNMRWIPEYAVIGDLSKKLVFDGDKSYIADFDSVRENGEPEIKILYTTDISISAGVINAILNKAYDDAQVWAKYRNYINECTEYEQKMLLYQSYLADKRVYDDKLEAYKVYLEDLEDYESAKAEYDAYLLKLEKYNEDYEKYAKYLEEQKNYNKKLELYNKYVENIEVVKSQLAIIDGTKVASTSLYRSVYSAIHGNLVKLVLENKDLVANDFVGGDGDAIDASGDATEMLKTIYAEYKTCESEIEKYTYYTVNYEKIRDNFIKLFSALDKLYQNAKIRIAIKDQGYKEKFEIFLAQLYYVVEAISDIPVMNFDGTAYYNSSYKINRQTPLAILEGKEYMTDTGRATPLSGGYPFPCEKPTITEVSEPTPPARVVEPVKPDEVKSPGTAPAVVNKPVSPSFVETPAALLPNGSFPDKVQEILSLYDEGKLERRTEFAAAAVIGLEINVIKKIFNSRAVEVVFCNTDGEELYRTVVDQGTYAEFVGAVPEKEETKAATYTFAGWCDSNGNAVDITAIESDSALMLYPVFVETKKMYDVVWELDGETVITQCEYGKVPTIGYTPKKQNSDKYSYKFAGWNKRVTAVTGDSSHDRYEVVFKKQYLVPLIDDLFDEDIGGAVLIENEGEWIVDCSANSVGTSYSSLRINLSNILPRVASNSNLTIKTMHYTATFSFSDVIVMNELGVSEFLLLPIKSSSDYYFTPKFFDANGKEIVGDFKVSLNLSSFRSTDPQNSRIYYETDSGRVYTRGKITENSLSVTALAGRTYHVCSEYSVILLPTGPVTVVLDKNGGTAGTNVEISYIHDPGIEVFSLYFIDMHGNRTEISANNIKIPVGGGFIGVDYDYIEYTVNFISSGRIIGTRVYKYGEIPEMMPSPIKTADGSFTYTFDKWINSSTKEGEVLPVTKNVNYEALYIKTEIPPKTPQTGLIISPSILEKLVGVAIIGVIALLAIVPCAVIVLFKLIIIARRKPLNRVKNKKTKSDTGEV